MMAKADDTPGAGERATRERSRRIWWIMGGMAAIGFVTGFATAFLEKDEGGAFPGALPPAFAIGAALVFVIAVVFGSWRYFRTIDEVERRNNYVGAIWGLNFYVVLYPVWFFLWKGGLVIEPMHEALFVATLVVTMIAYFWTKLRT